MVIVHVSCDQRMQVTRSQAEATCEGVSFEAALGETSSCLCLSYEEATRIQLLRAVEVFVSERRSRVALESLPIQMVHERVRCIPRSVKAFQWFNVVSGDGNGRVTERSKLVGIDGEGVRLVHPNLDVEAFVADPDTSFEGYECDSTRSAGFHPKCVDVKARRPQDARLLLIRENDPRQAVELHVHYLCRWRGKDGMVRALTCGTTLDVTESYFARVDAERKDFERDVIDHRYGNYIRECQLLLEAGLYDRLHSSLEVIADEIDVRRGKSLPNEPVDLDTLLRPCVQSLRYDPTSLPHHKFVFKTATGVVVPYKVLQVKILLDCLSNAIKHGDGFVAIRRTPDTLELSNRVCAEQSKTARRSSSRTGLRALRAECRALDLAIDFREEASVFYATIGVVTEEAGPSVDDAESTGSVDPRRLQVADLDWIIIDDQPTICALWSKHMAKNYGVDIKVVCSPAEVANAPAVLWETLGRSAGVATLVCIMDEYLHELTPDTFEVRPCTGATLRDRIFAQPKLREALDAGRIHLVGASSTDLHDARLHTIIGKHGTTRKMIEHVLDDVAAAASHQEEEEEEKGCV